jgi:hydroxyethylthiazole kinase
MTIIEDMQNAITAVRETTPLVHNMTNYVTVNDVANAVLAIGASPIMADAIEETGDITAISNALVINIGTLNARTVASMIVSGQVANKKNIPVVLDPVGAGASDFRNKTTEAIMTQVTVDVLRGNLSEISFVAGLKVATKGVDVAEADTGNDAREIAREVARRYGCVVVITGPVDVVSDKTRTVTVSNGTPLLAKITGTGCMSTAIIGAFAGACDDLFIAALTGITSAGIAGDIAQEQAGEKGTGSFRSALIDAYSMIDSRVIATRAKIAEIA